MSESEQPSKENTSQAKPGHQSASAAQEPAPPQPSLQLASSPHLGDSSFTTRRMMVEVIVALLPAMAVALYVFQWYAIKQVGLCVLSCVITEWLFTMVRRKPCPVGDYSAAVTGVILGLSLPWSAPAYVSVIGSVVGVGLGKVVFGGLGFNIFNPAMVGRAFVMLSFAKQMGASAYVFAEHKLSVVTGATPLTFAKNIAADLAAGKINATDIPGRMESAPDITSLLIGTTNGSLGETSALALAIGGIYLCARRIASWEIPAGVLVGTLLLVELGHVAGLTPFGSLGHLLSGALLFGAFFIATDPVTSPLAPKGKFIFGVGIGVMVVVFRLFSGYPEGLMFAVLLMNSAVPLVNRWTIPRPLGGPAPVKS